MVHRSAGDTPIVLGLAVRPSAVERKLVDEWVAQADQGRGIERVVEVDDSLGEVLAGYDEALLVPIRVAWLPNVQRDHQTSRWSELALMATPNRPATWIQRKLAARDPERQRVLTGEPGLLSDLRARHRRSVGAHPDEEADFGRFVRRAAIIALDRAERHFIGDRYKVPQHVIEEIISRAEFRTELVGLAHQLSITESEAIQRAKAGLNELVAVQTRAAVDLFNAIMQPLHSATWNVIADESSLADLRDLNKKHALVFLPSHRSYVDTLVLGDVLARNNFPRNHVMGGANLRIWPFSDIARRAGMVFIRRSFGDDKIYKACVQEYFGYLLSKRFNLEWYFEGGRSRTGKLRPPRFGLLGYVADAVTSRRVDDVYLVPVSITYDRLYEVGAMAAEQTGATKQAEGLRWLAEYARSQRRSTGGDAHVRFGQPIALAPHLPGPEASQGAQRIALQKVAFEVAVGINDSAPITANALLTLTLLGVRDHSLTAAQIIEVLAPILDYIDSRGLPTTGLDRLRDETGLGSVLAALQRAKVVTSYDGGVEPVYAIEPGAHLVAAFYRNNAIHWFINRAITELSMVRAAEVGGTELVDEGWSEALRIRDQFKFDFFFPRRSVFETQLREEMALLDAEWEQVQREGGTIEGDPVARVRESLVGGRVLMAHRVLRSFVDAHLVVAERLAAHGDEVIEDTEELLSECESIGQQMQLQGRLHGPESLSRELFASALDRAKNQRLFPGADDDLGARREVSAAYLRDLVRRVRMIESMDATNRAEVTGVLG